MPASLSPVLFLTLSLSVGLAGARAENAQHPEPTTPAATAEKDAPPADHPAEAPAEATKDETEENHHRLAPTLRLEPRPGQINDRSPVVAITPEEKAAEAESLLKLGRSLTERGDYIAAEIAYRQILHSTDYTTSHQEEALLGLADMHRHQGAYTKAVAIYEKFIKLYPQDHRIPDVLLSAGRTHRALGANKIAINRFYSVINSTLKMPSEGYDHYQLVARTAQFEIAETHFENGNYAEAGKFFTRLRLLDLAPVDRARAQFKAAYSLQLSGNDESAVIALREYLASCPDDVNAPEARYLLSVSLRKLGRNDEALSATLELLSGVQTQAQADPHRWSYWQRRTGNQLANEFFHNGDTANALALYQSLAALTPEPAWRLPVNYQMALCYERLRAANQARTTYQEIVEAVSALHEATPDLKELAKMASWRLTHLSWQESTDTQLTLFFSTTSGQHKTQPPAGTPHDPSTSPAKPSATL